VHELPVIAIGQVARCTRCGEVVHREGGADANRLCAAVAVAALILYPLGISLPVLRLRQLGHVHETSIWNGSISLLTHGQVLVGLAVLICSVVIPVVKLAGLLLLCSPGGWLASRHKARMYRWIDRVGRWGMMDVLLVAVTIAAVKLGDLVEVTPGPGVMAFGACVLLSLAASAVFNPHAMWQRE